MKRRSLMLASLSFPPAIWFGPANGQAAGTAPQRLPRLEAWDSELRDASQAGELVILLWGTPGCPWCDALRAEVMVHLWRNARQHRIRVYEFDLTDTRMLSRSPDLSPARLATRLGIRVSPTVTFHGIDGELAARLVGYPSRDFYNAYLDERIQQGHRRLQGS
jgi:thioredoxin-related protein